MEIDEALNRIMYIHNHCDLYEDCRFMGDCGECAEAMNTIVEALNVRRGNDNED